MRGFSPSTLGPAFSTVVFKLKCLVVRSQKEGILGRELGAVSLMTPLTLVRNCYVYRHAPLDHTFFALAPFTTPRRTCPLSRVFWVQGPRNPPSLRPPSSCQTFLWKVVLTELTIRAFAQSPAFDFRMRDPSKVPETHIATTYIPFDGFVQDLDHSPTVSFTLSCLVERSDQELDNPGQGTKYTTLMLSADTLLGIVYDIAEFLCDLALCQLQFHLGGESTDLQSYHTSSRQHRRHRGNGEGWT